MKMQESGEDYLEAMLMILEEQGYIRSIDIANKRGVTKPSVSYATKRLKEDGYITMDGDGRINLTDKGMAIANTMYGRHRNLSRFFVALGVSEDKAVEDACKIEHDLSDETYDAILKHMDELHISKAEAVK